MEAMEVTKDGDFLDALFGSVEGNASEDAGQDAMEEDGLLPTPEQGMQVSKKRKRAGRLTRSQSRARSRSRRREQAEFDNGGGFPPEIMQRILGFVVKPHHVLKLSHVSRYWRANVKQMAREWLKRYLIQWNPTFPLPHRAAELMYKKLNETPMYWLRIHSDRYVLLKRNGMLRQGKEGMEASLIVRRAGIQSELNFLWNNMAVREQGIHQQFKSIHDYTVYRRVHFRKHDARKSTFIWECEAVMYSRITSMPIYLFYSKRRSHGRSAIRYFYCGECPFGEAAPKTLRVEPVSEEEGIKTLKSLLYLLLGRPEQNDFTPQQVLCMGHYLRILLCNGPDGRLSFRPIKTWPRLPLLTTLPEKA